MEQVGCHPSMAGYPLWTHRARPSSPRDQDCTSISRLGPLHSSPASPSMPASPVPLYLPTGTLLLTPRSVCPQRNPVYRGVKSTGSQKSEKSRVIGGVVRCAHELGAVPRRLCGVALKTRREQRLTPKDSEDLDAGTPDPMSTWASHGLPPLHTRTPMLPLSCP
jgi:hypothetical protein